jgi:predicted DCC family thiol-disulfide oxidoreductase YuxK
VLKPSSELPVHEDRPILLYDGVCGLCNRGVQFILKHDHRDVFRFASLQSDFSADVLRKHGINPDTLDTVYLVLHQGDPAERLLARSDAGLAVLLLLGGVLRALALAGGTLPTFFLDFLYNIVARNRYRIFGKYDTCPLPTPEQRAKFLDQ